MENITGAMDKKQKSAKKKHKSINFLCVGSGAG